MNFHPLRLSPKTKAALAVALALLLWIPQGISQQTQPVVTGHSTFYNGDSYDPCLASVAGIVRSRVMWFNDQVLVERYPGKGTYVYITEHGGMDPTQVNTLYSEGVSYNFVDPNGAAWHVDEAYIDLGQHVQASTDTPSTTNLTSHPTGGVGEDYGVKEKKQYVWIVELAAQPIYDQFPGSDPHSYYNFLDIVDTCKFDNSTATYGGVVYHNASASGGWSGNGPSNGHTAGAADHTHTAWEADIYLGTAPTIVASPFSPYGATYDTSWATSSGPQQSAGLARSDASYQANNTVNNGTAPGGTAG